MKTAPSTLSEEKESRRKGQRIMVWGVVRVRVGLSDSEGIMEYLWKDCPDGGKCKGLEAEAST